MRNNLLVITFISKLIKELEYHPFIAPYLNVKRPIEQFLHQYEILAILSVRRPIRVMIADEIGLGKTITAIAIIKYLIKIGAVRKILVIVPRILVDQWITELDGMGINDVHDIEKDNIDFISRKGFPPGYYIGSIDLLKRERYTEIISKVDWDLIIIDEAHKMSLKGGKKTIRYNEIGEKLIGSRLNLHTIFLSATPHKGDPEDYLSRLKLLDPMLGSPKELDNRNFYRTTHEVLVFRRTKEDINNIYEDREVFKPATFFAVALPATGEEREFSERLLNFMRTKLLEFAEKGLLMNKRAIPLLRALLFKRASSSPKAAMLTIYRMLGRRSAKPLNDVLLEEIESIFELGYEDYEYEDRKDPDDVIDEFIDVVSDLLSEKDKEELKVLYRLAESIVTKGDSKINALLEILSDFVTKGNEKIIVFTEYRDTLNYIRSKILETHPDWNRKILTLSSVESHDKKVLESIRTRFEKDKNYRVLIATDVAGEGLNLQVANIQINYEVPWSIVKLEQRIGRVWRLRQERAVEIYTLFLGNRSDHDALNILYRKLINLERANISPRPLMGQEILVYQADAEEIGKIPMMATEQGKKLKRITESSLINAYIKGGEVELTEIVRSIMAAKQALQENIESKSVFYKIERKGRIEERLGLLGFRNTSELKDCMFGLFKASSHFYDYNISNSTKFVLKIQYSRMPMNISRVDEIIDLLGHKEVLQSAIPTLVSYGNEEETITIFRVDVYGKKDLLLREPIGISDKGGVFRGKGLLEIISNSLNNLIGVTEQDLPELDNIKIVCGPNSAQDSVRRLINPLEEYLNSLIRHGLRNSNNQFIVQKDLNARIEEPIGVITIVKRPLTTSKNISQEMKIEIERKAVEIVLDIEKKEDRLTREIPIEEQKIKHYDIHSSDIRTGDMRLIEVKGHIGIEIYAELTDDEAIVAKKEGKNYWLYIVYNIEDKFKLLRFRDPFNNMNYRIIEKVTKETRYILWPNGNNYD